MKGFWGARFRCTLRLESMTELPNYIARSVPRSVRSRVRHSQLMPNVVNARFERVTTAQYVV